jgi:phosphate transport system permease protein
MGKIRYNKIQTDGFSFRLVKNKVFYCFVIFMSMIAISPVVFIIIKLVIKGIRQINLNFFIDNAPNTLEAMTAIANGEIIPGGIANGITGSILMVLLASVMAIPVGVLTGIYLSENQDKIYANIIRNISEILQGVPSIVLGILSYLWIVINITRGFSAFAGSVSLAIMMLPLIIKSTEETLKMIPSTIKEAALSLGVPYHKVIFKVLLPTGLGGLLTGILLAISRVLGETAPLMLTALGSSVINFDITKPTSAVPLLIWEFYNDPNLLDLVWSSSLFLMGFVLMLNIIVKKMANKWVYG